LHVSAILNLRSNVEGCDIVFKKGKSISQGLPFLIFGGLYDILIKQLNAFNHSAKQK